MVGVVSNRCQAMSVDPLEAGRILALPGTNPGGSASEPFGAYLLSRSRDSVP